MLNSITSILFVIFVFLTIKNDKYIMENENHINLLISQSKEQIISYCSSLLHSEIIIDRDFMNNISPIYLCYPYLFSPLFNVDNESILQKLSLAGFLLYRATLISDRLIDKDFEDKILSNKEGIYLI